MTKWMTVIFLLILAMGSASHCQDQLIASYPFNGGGNNLNGIVHNATPVCDRFGNVNSALFFDGNAYVEVPHNSKLSFGSRGFTLCAWVKFCRRLGDYAGIIAKGPPEIFYPGYQLTITESGKLTTQIGDSTGYGIERRGTTQLNNGKWHFVALTVSSSKSAKTSVNLYVDGKLELYKEVYTPRAGLDASLSYTPSLFIGKERNSSVFFQGSIDDIEIYDEQLSEVSIHSLYNRKNWEFSQSLIQNEDTIVICNGKSVELIASRACYHGFRWSTGDFQSSISVDKPGIYTVEASDNEGCKLVDTVIVIECETSTELIAFYPFNNNAHDSTANMLHGIERGVTATCDRFGIANSAFAFNGKSFIEVPHNSKLSFGASSFSICAWIKFCQPINDYAGLVCKGPTEVFYPGYQLAIVDQNKVTTQIGDSSGYGIEQRGSARLDDGRWHFIVLVVKPSAKDKRFIGIYVDNKEVVTTNIYTPKSGLNSSLIGTPPLFIGTDRNSDRFFHGIIDDIRIFRGSISDSVIQQLFNEGNWQGDKTELLISQEGNPNFCLGDSIILNGMGCFSQWLWSTGDTTPKLTVYQPGIYSLTATDASGCQFSRSIEFKDNVRGEFITNLSKVYKVYPGLSKELFLNLESDVTKLRINQFEIDMQYDIGVAMLEKISLEKTILSDWNISVVSQIPGKYKAIFQAPNGQFIKGMGTIAAISFKTHLGDVVNSSVPYTITPLANTCQINVKNNPGFISIDSTLCGIEYRLIESLEQKIIIKNPFFDKKNRAFKFKLYNPMDQQVSLQLYDLSGKNKYELLNQVIMRGEYDIGYTLHSIPSGIYCLILISPYNTYSTLVIN